MIKKILKALVIIVLVVLAIAFVSEFIDLNNEPDAEVVTKEPEIVTEYVEIEVEKEITSEVVKEGLLDIGELATEEYSYTQVETVTSTKLLNTWKLPFTESGYIYSYDGVIKAGIDFTKTEVEMDSDNKSILITIPEAAILSHEIDTNSFKLYDEKSSIFNKLSVSDFNDSLDEMKTNAENKALEKGLLDKADENARNVIIAFLQSAYGLEDYSISVINVE